MTIPVNSPMAGKLKTAIEDRLSKAGRPRNSDGSVADKYAKGKFYDFFKKHNLFDINDSPYATKDQIDLTPEIDRFHQSDIIDAMVDCLDWFMLDTFGDGIGDIIQNMIDKTLVKTLSADGKVNQLTNAIGVVPGLQAVPVATEVMGSITMLAHGVNPFDIELLPRFSFNLPSLSPDFANFLSPGYIMPDWEFIRGEEGSSNTFYHNGNDNNGLRIGTNIDFGDVSEDTLSKIFVVNGPDENGNPVGDAVTGISPSMFNTMRLAVGKKGSDSIDLLTGDLKSIVLTEKQIIGSFIRFAEGAYWKPLQNPVNWMNAHWGSLGNNSCLSGVRTAIMSYVVNHGPAIIKDKHFISAFISYCVEMAVHYHAGYDNPVTYTHLGNTESEIDSNLLCNTIDGIKKVKYDANVSMATISDGYILVNETTPIIVQSIPRNQNIASVYYTLAADLLARRDYSSSLSVGDSHKLRGRRIREANKIYGELGLLPIPFGVFPTPPFFPVVHTTTGLESRYFDSLINGSIYRYAQVTKPGTVSNGTNDYSIISGVHSSNNYSDYYAPSVLHTMPRNLKRIRLWGSSLVSDARNKLELDGIL